MKFLIVFMLLIVAIQAGFIQNIKDKFFGKKEAPKCDEDKTFMTQGPACEMTCEDLLNPKVYLENQRDPVCKATKPGCFCLEGSVLNKKDNKCITKGDCLKSKLKVFG